jgi:DNA ligase (NAD+)
MPEIKSSVLEGKRFCITGKLSAPRKEIEEKIKAHGGMAASEKKPGKKAIDQYLICNNTSTSDKYVKAVTWGIPIITETQLDEMIGE